MRVSEYFSLNKEQQFLDFVDITLDTDIAVFLDPTAIRALDSAWGNRLKNLLQNFFETVLKQIKAGNHEKSLELLASLKESNHFHLGFSSGKSQGRAFGPASAALVWKALTKSKSSITGLLTDLEDTALLIDGIGPDMISDAVCNILREPLIEYTQQMASYYGIPLTQGVSSGPLWDSLNEEWVVKSVALPITDFGIIILVPKILCRLSISYRPDKYYTHFLLPEMQQDHLRRKTSLVKMLKNEKLIVYKSDLREKFGSNKLAIAEQTLIYPHTLGEYKQYVASNRLPPLEHEEYSPSKSLKIKELLSKLDTIKPGKSDAYLYEDTIEKLLSFCFYPSLAYPVKQNEIHEGRKRIDLTYNNEATEGFFYWLALHYTSPKIHIECKNYGKEIGNPDLDQLSGRFSPSRGVVGLLICRSIEDKELIRKRCKDTALDRRGYIIVLDDNDIKSLVEKRLTDGIKCKYPLLEQRFNELT